MQEILINHKKGEKPKITLTVRRVEPSVWESLGFYKHHYLTEKLNPSCKCFLFEWNGIPVAFVGILNTPRKNLTYDMAISRMVILPDYQGLGLSRPILDFCGRIIKSLGEDYRLTIKTAHTKMGTMLEKNDNWKPTQFNGKGRAEQTWELGKYNKRLTRKSYCYIYVGEKSDDYTDILKPIKEMRKDKHEKEMQMQTKGRKTITTERSLFENEW